VIPAAAVLDEDDKKIVYVVSDGEVLRRVVTTGIEQDGRYEILGGLESNEKIVIVGHSSLRDGSKVLASVSDKEHVSG
jgi:multidrug efflux pump subunit AcrA (membrane-fusion protein)